MAYTKHLRSVVPVAPGDDVELLRWLTRESFETAAGNQGLTVVEYAEAILSPDQIPPKAAEHLALPIEAYEWREFAAVAAVEQITVDWLVAESEWRSKGE